MAKKKESDIILTEDALATFGERAKLLRKERGLSMAELGESLGYSGSSIGMYETIKRTPDIKVLLAYSNFFDVPIDFLIGKTDVRNPLYAVACFSDFSEKDIGSLSKVAQEDIKKFIEYVMTKEIKK